MTRPEHIFAVIVTYNRKELLRECVRALLEQELPVTRIVLIDNASTDGTAEMVRTEWLETGQAPIELKTLERNGGGAGGFHAGIKHAMAAGADWIWLMDDDTIPAATALQRLLETHAHFPESDRPSLLASKVVWTDGSVHRMNFPTVKRAHVDPERALRTAENGTLWLRWASFVSVLIHRSAVEKHGLPFADYFIWNDDTEYTARICRDDLGVLVPASVVTHKTAQKHSPMDAAPARAYYQARNVLWMILRSPAWRRDEKMKI
ncbi:MAG TPA: glycosyltransferase family 2 protein, partial [Chthoniobacterales bacterium]